MEDKFTFELKLSKLFEGSLPTFVIDNRLFWIVKITIKNLIKRPEKTWD